jgi:hypothetical protein
VIEKSAGVAYTCDLCCGQLTCQSVVLLSILLHIQYVIQKTAAEGQAEHNGQRRLNVISQAPPDGERWALCVVTCTG